MPTIEVRPHGTMWLATHDGRIIGCAGNRTQVIDLAATMLRDTLADADFVGVTLEELLPPIASPSTPHPEPTIDFAEAKRRVAERWLPIAERRVGTAVHIVDERCVEYDWGWVVHWRPTEPEKGDPRFVNEYHFPFTADRVTGDTWMSGGTFGIERGIVELLQQRPDDLRGPYPPGRRGWLVALPAFRAAGAFEPRRHEDERRAGE